MSKVFDIRKTQRDVARPQRVSKPGDTGPRDGSRGRKVEVSTFAELFIGSVFVVKRPGERGKFVKLNPGCSIDEAGKDAIFDQDTPVKLIGRAKLCVIDYSA